MLLVVTGSRYGNESVIYNRLIYLDAQEIWAGDCSSGADAVAARVAKERNLPFRLFEADWNAHGRAAGPYRNSIMAFSAASKGPVAVIAFPARKAENKCTKDMIRKSLEYELDVSIKWIPKK